MTGQVRSCFEDTIRCLAGRGGTPDAPPLTPGQPSVELADVSVRLGEVTALDGIDLTVEPGQFVGLIGPNGAGKTTVLRAITAAVTADTGRVRLGGSDVRSLSSRAVSRLVAVVPQDTAIAFDFAVREIVAMGRTPYQDRIGGGDRSGERVVEDAMEWTDVVRFADRPISGVSGGERQRVLLARAIAQETPILLLDEPTASLDIAHQLRTFELVRSLVDEGKTVIAAIHDLNVAARYCDELVLLDDGGLVGDGSPEQVLTAEAIRTVFGAETRIGRHPVTETIHVFPVAAAPGPATAESTAAPDDEHETIQESVEGRDSSAIT